METTITRIDQMEARVEFGGSIVITYERKSDFQKELDEIVEKYAI